MLRAMRTKKVRSRAVVATVLALGWGNALAGSTDEKDDATTVTIWRAPALTAAQQYYGGGYYGGGYYGGGYYGGGYGGYTYTGSGGDAAFVTHQRTVEIESEGELRFPGVSTQIDPSTVQFRSITDSKSTSVVEQRYAYDLGTPEKLMQRYLGKSVSITTTRGETTGILRGIDAEALVLETGSGASRAVEIIRRGENLLDVKLAAGNDELATVPTLVWKVVSKKPGKQQVEVQYRTDGLRWDADYTAILDDEKDTLDLSAWATINNDTGVEFKETELVLTTGILDNQQPQPQYSGGYTYRAPSADPVSFKVPRTVTIPSGGTVQVELVPARTNVKATKVITYAPVMDQSMNYYYSPQYDCYNTGYFQPGTGPEEAIEITSPSKGSVLPEGKARVYKRKGDGLELLGEDNLIVNNTTGDARLRLGTSDKITGERRSVDCKYDDRARTVREKIEIKIENKGKDAIEVIVKDYLYRWAVWKMEAEDVPGSKAASQTQEWRVKLNGNSKKTFNYTVLYSW